MAKSNCTFITLDRDVDELINGPEWSGTPDAETGVFTIGKRYVIRFIELRINIMPESVMGYDKPILSMRYHASLMTGKAWARGNELNDMVPYGKWYFDGRDDLGTEYEYQQGASGFLDPAHTIFDSDISFEPDVPVNARWVEIRFMDRRNPAQPVHTFRSDVPTLQRPAVP
jgi:hypothetical protein